MPSVTYTITAGTVYDVVMRDGFAMTGFWTGRPNPPHLMLWVHEDGTDRFLNPKDFVSIELSKADKVMHTITLHDPNALRLYNDVTVRVNRGNALFEFPHPLMTLVLDASDLSRVNAFVARNWKEKS